MIACVDVHYSDATATAACVVFKGWADEDWVEERIVTEEISAPYEPGKLYLRELPPLLSVLFALENQIEIVIVDGNVWLDDEGKPGLGARLHDALKSEVAVIGVAKGFYYQGDSVCEVKRGESARPLYVTSVGIALTEAAENIGTMLGAFRVPMTLKRADSLCRGHCECGSPACE